MNNVRRLKDRHQVEEEAATWVWRLDDDDVCEQTRAAYEQWLKEDPRHCKAVEEYRALWGRLDFLQTSRREEKIRTVSRGIDRQEADGLFAARWRYGAVAACLALFFAAAFVFSTPAPEGAGAGEAMQVQSGERTYATAIGQMRTVELEDGSKIEMNTDSEVTVDYTGTVRQVTLRRGEAHFKVAKNSDRPFIVTADGTSVRAVGTAFNVRLVPETPAEVLVTEGKVEVRESLAGTTGHAAPRASEELILTAGQSIRADMLMPDRIASVSRSDVDRALAWRKGMLIFEGEPLENVVQELSRYTQIRFIIIDDRIRDRRVGGYFRTGDVDAILSVLEQGLSIEIERQDQDIILLSDASGE